MSQSGLQPLRLHVVSLLKLHGLLLEVSARESETPVVRRH
jgi:hypothetical protein